MSDKCPITDIVLRDRIAAVLNRHKTADRYDEWADCQCGHVGTRWDDHVADAVIEALGAGNVYRYACYHCGDFWFDKSERMQRFALLHNKGHLND